MPQGSGLNVAMFNILTNDLEVKINNTIKFIDDTKAKGITNAGRERKIQDMKYSKEYMGRKQQI